MRPDDATLGVYADFLQSQGDPRGELIALDLRPPSMSLHSVEVRRGQLLRTWLGDEVEVLLDPDQQLWYVGDLSSTYATFDCGFVDLFIDDPSDDALLAHLLHGSGGEHLRRVSIQGSEDVIEPMLAHLVAKPRPWLQQLAVSRTDGWKLLVDRALGERFVAATPNLEVLDLLGRNLFDRLAHPTVRELGITGCESIDLADGPPMPALHTIDFAFDGESPTPRGLFGSERVPALRRFNCSRNEPGNVQLFAELGTLGVAAQITHLVLPSIRSRRDHALVQAAIDRMPMLREIQLARAYATFGPIEELRHSWARVKVPSPLPWPPREMLVRMLAIDGYATDLTDLVDVLEEQYDDLPEEQRAIWYRFWTAVDSLQGEQAFNVGDLSSALGALVVPPHLASLRDRLLERVRQRRQNYFAMLYWI